MRASDFILVRPVKLAVLWLALVEGAVWASGGSNADTWLEEGRRAGIVFAAAYLLLAAFHAVLWWNGVPHNEKDLDNLAE